jgi:uncharacterized lipoprotein YajG
MKAPNMKNTKYGLLLLLAGSLLFQGCASQPPSKTASNLKLETITNDARVNYVFRTVK